MLYYGTRLSENISRRPEGYLLCLNVPVARTGAQEYLPEELGLSSSGPVEVFRPEEEVFSPECIASFEGIPVTNDHPPDGVTIENIRSLQKGHAQNIRRGSGENADLLLADLLITDPRLISAILDGGKREISCGYTYELCQENGAFVQRGIRGNHVAVVDAGRAGPRVSIKDQKPKNERSKNNMKNPRMNKSLMKKLALMARDGDPEAIEAVTEIVENLEPDVIEIITPPAEEETPAPAAAPAEEETAADEVTLGGIAERLDRLIALLTPAAADEDPSGESETDAESAAEEIVEEVAEAVEEAVESAAEAVESEILSPDFSTVYEPEEEGGDAEEETVVSSDALRAALSAVRPALARMPRRQREKVAADIAARLRGKRAASDRNAYAALAGMRRRPANDPADLGRRIMEKRNINMKH